jgi:Ribbon-helix-helix protein, copG family
MDTGKHRLEIKIGADTLAQLKSAAKARGFRSANAFVRAAIATELRSGESALDRTEQNIAASIDRLAREVRSLQNAQQSTFALADALARLFLTCVPEPPPEALDHAKASARLRYERFLVSVAQSIKGGGGRRGDE